MQRDPKTVTDGFTNLERGMDSGRDASLIGRNQYSAGINATVRGAFVENRPGYRKVPLDFASDAILQARFEDGRWQGAHFFKPHSAEERIVVSISGRLFAVTPDQPIGEENKVVEITPRLNRSTLTKANFTVPAVGSNVQISVGLTSFMFAGLNLTIDGDAYDVVSVDSVSHVTVVNIDATPAGTVVSGTAVLCSENSDVNNSTHGQAWMEQAEDFLIVQDGQAKAVIYNGNVSRRASFSEVPTGTVMVYGLGRLWVANGREFVAGDIVRGPSGTSLYGFRDAVLKFTENDYLAEGGAFAAPEDVTAMVFPANLDTSLGESELVVFFESGAVTIRIPPSREDWKNLSIPLQRVSLKPYGATGPNSIVEVNDDVWFRSRDGIRSFIMAQRMFDQTGNVPMSREMDAYLNADDPSLLGMTNGVLFDNRLLMSCVPQRSFEHGTYFLGLIALDFDITSAMFQRSVAAYDGLWTGLKILQLVKGTFGGLERCFAFVLSSDSKIELWELTTDDIVDRPDSSTETRIDWSIIPKSFGFPDAGDDLKELASFRMFGDRMRGIVDFCVEYRPDQYPIWTSWHCWTKRATKQWCAGADCMPTIPLPQFRTRMTGPNPPTTDELTDNKPMRLGNEFQVRISVKGACRIRRMRLKAYVREEDKDSACGPCDTDELLLTGCDANWPFGYVSDGSTSSGPTGLGESCGDDGNGNPGGGGGGGGGGGSEDVIALYTEDGVAITTEDGVVLIP